ncbi:MAG: hypothetical protein LBH27_01650, partial [Endomicrobium sp.]|nr:hypothetical protein [Endomicrobium sp.]
VSKKINKIKIAMIGAGAANVCIYKFLSLYGADQKNIILVDSCGIISKNRDNLIQNSEKWKIAMNTNTNNLSGGISDAMENADVVIALSMPGPGVIKKEWIKMMAKNPIVFACANPIPEIWPWEAKDAGAAIVATGRSDFPNQINNSLGFPGVFRGVLNVMASTITDTMCIRAAEELASCITDNNINPNKILPNMDDWEIFPKIAAAIGTSAIKENIARKKYSYNRILNDANMIIKRSRAITKTMMKSGYIKNAGYKI